MLVACQGGGGPPSSQKSAKTDWRTTGPFATKRAALKKALETFPADLASLPRCKPGLKAILLLSYNTASLLYARDAAPAPDIGTAPGIDVGSKRFFLESIERAAWESAPPEDLARWEKPPLDWVSSVALFKATAVKSAQMAECTKTAAGQDCKVLPGVVEGDVSVFGDDGRPTCSNRLRVEGPVAALIRASQKLDDYQRMAMEQILDGYFYYGTETVPNEPAWRFLSLHQAGQSPSKRYTVTIDGALVQTAVAN